MAEKLGSACIPTPDFDDGQDDRIPFFDPPTIELMRRVGCEDVRHHEFKPAGVTNLEEGIVVKAKEELRQLNMVGGVWDKAPTKFYAVCSVLRDARLLNDTLGSTKFTIWGRCASVIIHTMLSKARERGIVSDWIKRAWPRCEAWLKNPTKTPPKGVKAQIVFDILKWKSREVGPEPLLKWRDVVSFAGHLLRPWARYIGRCLQLLIQELGGRVEGLGFQNMPGVRDQVEAVFEKSPDIMRSSLCSCTSRATAPFPALPGPPAYPRKNVPTTYAHRPPWKWTWRTCFGRSPKRRSQRPWIRPCPLYGEKRSFNGFAYIGGGEET